MHMEGVVQVALEEKGETRHTPHHSQNDAASFESRVSTSSQLATLLYHVLFMTVAIIHPNHQLCTDSHVQFIKFSTDSHVQFIKFSQIVCC